MKPVVHNKPRNKSSPYEQKVANHCHKQKAPISPHASEALAHRHVLLQSLLRRALAAVVLTGHEVAWIYWKRRKPLQGCEGREVQRNRSGCRYRCVRGQSLRLVFEAAERRDGCLEEVQKATAINRRRSATSLILRKMRC